MKLSRIAGLAILCVSPCAGHAWAAPAAMSDKALLAAAERGGDPALADLQTMVDIRSGSHMSSGLKAMADFLDHRLAALGGKVERVPVPPAEGDAIVARFTGRGRARILLMAHMDTVYPEGTDPAWHFHREGGRAFGPGVVDDKGGIAVVLQVLAMLAHVGFRDYGQVTVLVTSDEETGSHGASALIERLAKEHDYVLSCEPGGHEKVIATSGIAQIALDVKGVASHAGVAPQAGSNALVEAADLIARSSDFSQPDRGLKFNWTMANAGLAHNIIPPEARVIGDMRYTDPADPPLVMARLRALAAQPRVAGTSATVTFTLDRPPMSPTPGARMLAGMAQDAGREINFPVRIIDTSMGGGSDANFAAVPGIAAVAESFGLGGGHAHTTGQEYMDIDTLVPSLYIMARVITRLSQVHVPVH